MQVNLYDVIDALENNIEGNEWFYYIPEQKIIGRNSEGFYGEGIAAELPMKDVIALPDHRAVNDYGNMERFIEYEVKGEAQEWLRNSIRGRGAFRRFRGTLERFLLTDDWYDYLFECHRNTAIDWCEANGIVYTEKEPQEPEEDDYDYDDDEYEEEPRPVRPQTIVRTEPLRIVQITEQNLLNIVFPAAKFAVFKAALSGRKIKEDTDQAEEHLHEVLDDGKAVFAVSDRGRFVAYSVLSLDRSGITVEELYTVESFRRRTAATMLLKKAEQLAEEEQVPGVRFLIQPQNKEMTAFLAANGYRTLKHIEIVKDHGADQRITVGDTEYYSF